MKPVVKKLFILISCIALFGTIAAAQDEVKFVNDPETPMESVEVEEVIPTVESLVADTLTLFISEPLNTPWKRASIDGKLRMEGLPLSPSLKIFMEKDSLIDISIRAPFIGEAVRITLTPRTVIAVNKMKKTYMEEGIADFLKYYPGGLEDVQNLLLARVFLPGIDLSTENILDYVDINNADNQINLIPKGRAMIEGVKYGFVVDEEFDPLMLIVLPDQKPDTEIAAVYEYNKNGYDLRLFYQEGNQSMEAMLELKEPNYEEGQPKALEIGNKYKRLSIGEFMRNF